MTAREIMDVVVEKLMGQAGSCKAFQEDRAHLRIVLQENDASCVHWSAYDPPPLPVEKGQIFKVINEKCMATPDKIIVRCQR